MRLIKLNWIQSRYTSWDWSKVVGDGQKVEGFSTSDPIRVVKLPIYIKASSAPCGLAASRFSPPFCLFPPRHRCTPSAPLPASEACRRSRTSLKRRRKTHLQRMEVLTLRSAALTFLRFIHVTFHQGLLLLCCNVAIKLQSFDFI